MTGTSSTPPAQLPGPAHPELLVISGADVLFEGSTEGVTTWVSPGIEQLLGWTPDQVIGRPFKEFVAGGDLEALRRTQQRLNEGHEGRARLQVRHVDGSARWIDVTVRPFVDGDGRVAGRYGSWRDAEDSVRAEEDLRAALIHRDALFAAVLDPIVTLEAVRDDDGAIVEFRCVDANPAALEVLGLTHDEVVGPLQTEVYPTTGDVTALRQVLAHVVETGAPLVADAYPYQFPGDSVPRYFNMRASRLGDGVILAFGDISERLEANERLAESEARLRLLAENVSDVIYSTDPDHLVTWVSPSITRILGWQPQEIVGTVMADLLHPEDRAEIDAARERVYAGSASDLPPGGALGRVRTRDGAYRWMTSTITSLRDGEGRPAGLVGALTVVDDLVQARQRAERDEALLRATSDALLDPLVVFEPVRDDAGYVTDFRFIDVNRATTEYLGLSREEFIGRGILDIFPAFGGSGLLDIYRTVLATHEPAEVTDFVYDNDVLGIRACYDLRVTYVLGDRLSLTWRDVTEQRAAAAMIAESEARLRLMTDNTSDVVLLAGPDGAMTYVSPSITAMLGWSPDDLVGHQLPEFFHPDDLPLLAQVAAKVTSGSPSTGEARVRTRDGDYRWVESSVSPVVDADGTVSGRAAVWRDVTERHETQRALADSEQRFRLLAENATDVVVHVRDGVIV